MSSILDSLKKLEKETARQDHPLTRARTDKKAAVPISSTGARYAYLYYRGVPQKVPATPAVEPASSPKPANASTEPEESPAPEPGPSAPSPSRPVGNLSAADASDAAAAPAPAADRKAAPPAPAGETYRRPDAGQAVPPAAALQATTGNDGQVEQVRKTPDPHVPAPAEHAATSPEALPANTPAREEQPAAIDRLQGSGLKIQAISWSDTPEKSLAVVNNQVLREGADIEGYHISRINPDDIVLQRDGKAYRLEFRSSGMQ